MKKKLITLLLFSAMVISLLTGCLSGKDKTTGGTGSPDTIPGTEASQNFDADTPEETPVIRVACTPYSGHILHAIAEEKGFYEDVGVQVELYFTHYPVDANAALLAGQVDVASTYGTTVPLQSIADGSEFTIFGGYMLQGCMPVIGREGSEISSVEDLIGKRVIGSPAAYYISGPLMDLGYDPYNDIEWVQSVDVTSNLELVRKGEADYCPSTTGLHTQAAEMGLIPACFASDLLPEYSCCRVYSTTEWLNENQDAAVCLMKAWMRAQEVLETDKDFAVEVTVAQTELTKEYVEGFIKNDHFMIRLDPHWQATSRAWDYLDRLGVLGENTDIQNLKEHFTTDIYKAALDAAYEDYYDENPEYYDYYVAYFNEVNSDIL